MNISVALCTYNGEEYLSEQLDSILQQSRPPDEIVISDDGSQDTTPGIIEEYKQEYDSIISVVSNEKRLGVVKNFEKAIRECKGEIIFLSDQDDLWKGKKIEKHINHHQRDSTELVFNNSIIADKDLCPMKSRFKVSPYKPGTVKTPLKGFHELLKYNFIKGCEMSISKSLKENILPIPSAIPHDYYIGLVGVVVGTISEIVEPLQYYRRHDDNESSWNDNWFKKYFLSGFRRWSPEEYRKHHRKWKAVFDSISKIDKSGFLINKRIVLPLLKERKEYQSNRSDIYSMETNRIESLQCLTENIKAGYYNQFSVQDPHLYILKDLSRILLGNKLIQNIQSLMENEI